MQRFFFSSHRERGFSLVELVTTVGILAVITTMVAVNFRSGERSRSLRLGAEDIASNVRRVQNFALTGKEITTNCTTKVGKAYEARFTYTQAYTLVGILKDECVAQGVPQEVVLELGSIPRFARVGELGLASSILPTSLRVRFAPPFGNMSLSGDGGTTYYPLAINDTTNATAYVELALDDNSRQLKVFMDRMSGRITIQ